MSQGDHPTRHRAGFIHLSFSLIISIIWAGRQGNQRPIYDTSKDFLVVHHAYTEFESHPSSCPVGTLVLLFAGKATETKNWRFSSVYCRVWLAAELCFYPHSYLHFDPSVRTGISCFIAKLRCYRSLSSKW
jgi:hypothetical protein